MESSTTNDTTKDQTKIQEEEPQKSSDSTKPENGTPTKSDQSSEPGWLGKRMGRVKSFLLNEKPESNNNSEAAAAVARRVTVSVSEGNMEKKEGYLTKKGGYFRKQHKYWFELDPFTEYVSYYTNPSSNGSLKSKLVGSFNLEGSKIESVPEKQQITIKTKNGKNLILTADSTAEMANWYNAFTQARDVALASSQQLLDQWKSDDKLKEYVAATTPNNTEQNNLIIDDDVDEDEKQPEKEDEEEVQDLQNVQVEGLQNFLNLMVEDKDGNPTAMKDALSKNTITLLIVLRHFGCMLCRQQAGHILQRRMDFATLGIPIVAIGIGTPVMAKSFAKEFSFPGQLFTDQKREVYKALSLRRGLRYALINSKTIAVAKKASKEGYSQGPTTGDVLQLGGAFVVSQKSGFIFEHKERFAGDHANLDEVLTICEQYIKEHPYEQWSNAPKIPKDWSEVVNPESLPASLVRPSDETFHVESGRNKVVYNTSKYVIEETDTDFRYYSDNFLDTEHENFSGDLGVKDGVDQGQFVLSIQKNKKGEAKAILRTPQCDTRYLIPVEHCSSSNSILQYLQNINPVLEGVKFRKMREADFPKRLVQFEDKLIVNQYKFGVMYCGPKQTTESDMYNNVEGSPEYQEFLDFLGERIKLAGWKKYCGGLSTADPPLTGTDSYYTKFQNFEIMFHVSTLLPFKEADAQRIERKKHIGNDVVVIIFKDSQDKTPIDPKFKSQFNHVFVVVSVEYKDGQDTFYRVSIANKPNFPPYGPYLPEPAIFKKSEDFRNFLFTKLINSERSATTYAPGFKNRIRTRTQLLHDMIKESLEAYSMSKEVIAKVKKITSAENGSFMLRSDSIDLTAMNNNNSNGSEKEKELSTSQDEQKSQGVTPSTSTENLSEFSQKPTSPTTAPSPWTTASPVKQPRVTIRKFRTQKGGVVMFLPNSMEEFLSQASSVLSMDSVVKIRSAETEGEIRDIDLIRDGDILFVCTEQDEELLKSEM